MIFDPGDLDIRASRRTGAATLEQFFQRVPPEAALATINIHLICIAFISKPCRPPSEFMPCRPTRSMADCAIFKL